MIKASLVLLLDTQGRVFLGYKKKGEIGSKTLNAPGGKQEDGETMRACGVRELYEEISVTISEEDLELCAVIMFFKEEVEPDFCVYVYRVRSWSGKPVETPEMIPDEWYTAEELPFDRMLSSDHAWFERAVRGEKFNAHVRYSGRAEGYLGTEFLPFEEVQD